MDVYSKNAGIKPLPSTTSISVFPKKDIFYISAIIALIFIIIVRTGFKAPGEKQKVPDTTRVGTAIPDWQPVVFQKELNLEISPVIPESLVVSVWINDMYFQTIEQVGE